jgi:uncharacterized protein DUF4384
VRIGFKSGNRLPVGGEFVISVQSDVPGRLIVVDIKADGEVTQLFPNRSTPTPYDVRMQAGLPITIPGPGYGSVAFKSTEPVGKGRLLALVVPDDFTDLTSRPASRGSDAQFLATRSGRRGGLIAEGQPTTYLMNLA